jgi:putative restriction endonuclease
MARDLWTREQLIVAFNLYCKIPFGKIHNRNPEIITLAKALGRTPSALSYKLANFARLDPMLKQRNIAGATHGGRLEEEVWDEFNDDWERLAFESETLRLSLARSSQQVPEEIEFPEGKTREATVRARVNQGFFRAAVLAAYDMRCCITGIGLSELLSASHIVPWTRDVKNRTNPRNGLCLSAIHDRAFDRGLLTISEDHEVVLSSHLRKSPDPGTKLLLNNFEGAKIRVPERFPPKPEFLAFHRQNIFRN